MTCGSGCCGPPKSPVGATPEPFHQKQPLIDESYDVCYDEGGSAANEAGKATCGEDMEPELPAVLKFARNDGSHRDDNEPASRPSSRPGEVPVISSCRTTGMQSGCHKPFDINLAGCQDACCNGPTKKTKGSVGSGAKDIKIDDNCCCVNDHDCRSGCCSVPEPSQVEDPNDPSCCKGSPLPCCDVSCLDRLALRACDSARQAARIDQASKSKQQCPLQLRCLLLTSLIYSSSLVSFKLSVQRKQRWKTVWPPRSYHPCCLCDYLGISGLHLPRFAGSRTTILL
jgi:hypothetical protein